MPTYDLRCDNEHYFEMVCRIDERESQRCELCDLPLRVVIASGPAIIGAMPSKPLDFSKQLGRVFETNAEFRQYMADNPDAQVISKSSEQYVNMRDRLRNKMDDTARKMGYRDHEHKTSSIKAANS